MLRHPFLLPRNLSRQYKNLASVFCATRLFNHVIPKNDSTLIHESALPNETQKVLLKAIYISFLAIGGQLFNFWSI